MEFKKLSDVEVVAEPTETANVLIEENGVIKKAPKTAVGGAGGAGHWVMLDGGAVVASDGIYEAIYSFFTNLQPISIVTYRVNHDEDLGHVAEIFPSPCNGIYWNQDAEIFNVNNTDGIVFYIQKDGNHDYYWD